MSNRTEKIVRNTLFNIAGSLWNSLVYFLLIPYVISKIGVEGYGVWTLAYIFINCITYVDLSLNTAYVKYISEYYTKRDYQKMNEVINTGGFFYLFFALIVASLLFPLKSLFLALFKIPSPLLNDALFVFYAILFFVLIAKIFEAFLYVLVGMQRMDVSNSITMTVNFARVIGVFVFLERGWGLKGLALNEILMILSYNLALVIQAKRLLPEIKIGRKFVKMERWKELFRFGVKLYVSGISTLTHSQFDKLILSHISGLRFVTYYDLGAKVVRSSRDLLLLLTAALVPAVVELKAEGEEEKVFLLYQRSTKYLVAFGLPLFFFAIATAPEILRVWLGNDYHESVLVLRILAVGYFANLTTGTLTSTVQGIGKPILQMRASLFTLLLNIPLSLFLISKVGYWGAAMGTSLAMVLGGSYFFYSFHRTVQKSLFNFLKRSFSLPLMSSILGSLLLFLVFPSLHPFLVYSRPRGIFILGLTLMLFSVFHLFFLFKTGYFDSVDRGVFKGLWRMFTFSQTSISSYR